MSSAEFQALTELCRRVSQPRLGLRERAGECRIREPDVFNCSGDPTHSELSGGRGGCK